MKYDLDEDAKQVKCTTITLKEAEAATLLINFALIFQTGIG